MSIFSEIVNFYAQIENDEYHRFKSWEHCYSYFQGNEVIDDEHASLQLAFYLASWGMYRGSSYLLWKDYKIHASLINELNTKNELVIKLDFNEENDSKNSTVLLRLIKNVKLYYSNKIIIVNGENREVKPSNILASKVLLGINACIPAFDRYFIKGLKLHDCGTSINKGTLIDIFKFYRKNKVEFDRSCEYIKKRCGIEYPPMKLVDMYFWEIGRKEEENSKRKRVEQEKT
jgi:hypothetical protein